MNYFKPNKIAVVIILLWGGIVRLQAQSGPVTSGGDATGSGGSVSYSVGQIDYIAPTGAGGNSNEGLQQPYEIFTFSIEDPSISLELSLYPNPTTSSVFLKVEKEDINGLLFQLFDVSGKQVLNRNISNQITEINLETFTSGTYVLQVIEFQKPIQTFKIIKK